LFDAQKYILQSSWNAQYSLWACSRDFGKSFIGSVLMLLKALLYSGQAIYIVSSVGDQAKETFSKIEEIVMGLGKTANSIKSLADIAKNETVKSGTNKTGFSHPQTGYHVGFYNGSEIFTLNSNPDNNRSRRASTVFFDEAAYCLDDLIIVCEAFALQNSEFKTSVNDSYRPDFEKKQVPAQLVYASSQDEMVKLFYRHYKDFAKQMYVGNRDYFVCDMICDTALFTYMNGKPYTPLLTKDKVDAAMRVDREKAMREYYNQPTRDGGQNQIIKWSTIRRNENFLLPEVTYHKGGKYVIAFDPARSTHQSVLGVMKICESPDIGYYGEIVNVVNLVDLASRKKIKLDSNRQLDIIKEMLISYNGKAPDYENILKLLIDAGAGGGGVSTYADGLLKAWFDNRGIEHKGLLDTSYELYEGFESMYPDNSDAISLINPRKFKKQMTEEAIETLELGLVRFPFEYQRHGYVTMIEKNKDTDEEERRDYSLSWEEETALVNIDQMKTEATSIYRFKNAENTTVTYALPQDKQAYLDDDRFYVLIMLCHFLYDLRRGNITARDNSQYEYLTLVD
jgi:hypothetical protein